jgi:TatD DNase family protein
MLIDTHAHLDQEEFAADLDAVMERAAAAGVERIVTVGVDAATSRAAIALAEKYPQLRAAVGIQPNNCAQVAEDEWEQIVALADNPKVAAIGETGLDRYWDYAPLELHQSYFDRHLRLAQRRGLPAIVHCRDAQAEVVSMLGEAAARGPIRGVLHAFSSDAGMARQCVELGLYVSFAGMVTYTNKKFQTLREAAVSVPDDRILIETDSPYLVPHPLRGKQQRNEPAHIALTAQSLAALRGASIDDFAAQTTANARRLFQME